MKLCDVNPHIRFASKIHHVSEGSHVKVTDCRLFYVTDGQAVLRIANQSYTLSPRSLFYCRGGSDYILSAPEGIDLISLNFDLTQANNDRVIPFPPRTAGWEDMLVLRDDVQDSSFLNGHYFLPDAGELSHGVFRIVDSFMSGRPYAREISGCGLKELLLRLHRTASSVIPQKVRLIRDYIDAHYAENINNQSLAAMAGYHEFYLNRIFQACIGASLHEYLLKIRLDRASYLILNTDLPLKAIPDQVGFHSYPHFSSYFKQRFGYSPGEYRKNLRGNI